MGAIPGTETDWAVVHRLAQMLDGEPHHAFNITQAYALFTPILCWTMQRMRKGDGRGKKFQRFLQGQRAAAAPWSVPLSLHHSRAQHLHLVPEPDDDDIANWPVESFLIALRNAVAHADDRCVVAENDGQTLIGYRFKVEVIRKSPQRSILVAGHEQPLSLMAWKGDIVLTEKDMRRIGSHLARRFCEYMTDLTDDERRQANAEIGEAA